MRDGEPSLDERNELKVGWKPPIHTTDYKFHSTQ
jgi:hypothetical protein